MRFISFLTDQGPGIGVLRSDQVVELAEADPTLPRSMRDLLAQGQPGLSAAQAAVERTTASRPLDQCHLLPPVPDPQKIICVGLNYIDHAQETGAAVPEEPVIFNKFPTALRACGEDIVLPPECRQVDYEAELVVVIGRSGRRIPRADALQYVAGYTCGHDVSARDWQKGKPGGQWLLGKSFDSFAPVGPALVTADEIPDPGSLDVTLRLNGQTMQQSNTRQLIFSVEELIAYVSTVCTLFPGDLLFTGTPAGVGMARRPPVYLQPGDEVEVEISGIGILRNRVAVHGE